MVISVISLDPKSDISAQTEVIRNGVSSENHNQNKQTKE